MTNNAILTASAKALFDKLDTSNPVNALAMILGFYKILSDEQEASNAPAPTYTILPAHLFSHWLTLGSDFDGSHLRDAIHAFSRMNPEQHAYNALFAPLVQGLLRQLGKTSQAESSIAQKVLWQVSKNKVSVA